MIPAGPPARIAAHRKTSGDEEQLPGAAREQNGLTLDKSPLTLDEKKALVTAFLERCNTYADDEVERYRRRLELAEGTEALELAEKIARWAAYRAFNEHAIGELASARLDDWFG